MFFGYLSIQKKKTCSRLHHQYPIFKRICSRLQRYQKRHVPSLNIFALTSIMLITSLCVCINSSRRCIKQLVGKLDYFVSNKRVIACLLFEIKSYYNSVRQIRFNSLKEIIIINKRYNAMNKMSKKDKHFGTCTVKRLSIYHVQPYKK